MTRIATPSAIGDNHKYAILKLIKSNSGIARDEIARALQLSVPAVSKNVTALIEAGIVYESGTVATQLGRKPTLLYYNTRLLYVASIEIMPQGIRGVLADSVGNIVLMDEKPSQVHDSAEAILKSAIATIAYLCDHRPVESEVACICVASPGCSDTANRFNLLSTYQEDWSDIDLSGEIKSHFGIPTILRNDVELDLAGECWRGAGRGCNNILLIKYGDGFACRAMVDGNLLHGARYLAGEIGYLITGVDQLRPSFRSPGALEQRLSRDIFTEYREKVGISTAMPETIRFPWLLRRANDGDEVAARFVQEAIDLISIAVNNAVLVLNPEMIILAGDAAEFRKSDVQRMRDVLQRSCPMAPIIRRADLGNNTSIYGGICVALEHAEQKLADLWK